ncbi:hypothetical protein [Falsirhodobacter sp. 1013]|uniref:hypothetical protein n=1 Tax=Falsirhodobacter sp. 1013 TaxID=3417566 RepID=UPI003EB8E3B5
MTVPKFSVPGGTHVTLGGVRVMIAGRGEIGYEAVDLDTGQERIIPFGVLVDYLNLPGARIDTATAISGDRIRHRLGGYLSSKGLSKDALNQARVYTACCIAMATIRNRMREEAGDDTLQLSGRLVDLHRPEIRDIVQDLTGERIYLSVPRNGKSDHRHLLKGRKLMEKFRVYENLAPGESAIDALVPVVHLRGNRTARIQPRTKELMTRAWEEVGLDEKKASVASVLRHLEMLIDEENTLRARNDLGPLKLPSPATMSAHRKAIIGDTAYLVATTGERNARKKVGRGSTDIRALLVGEYVEIDECKASLVVSAKATGRWESLGNTDRKVLEAMDKEIRERLHILVMIDVASRMPLAWVVSDQPRAEATLALFRMATRSKAREARVFACEGQALPGIGIGHVKNDNGTGLRNASTVAALMGGAASMNTIARAYSPTERPYIERMFGTEESVLLQLIHGYTGRKPGELPGYDAVENGVLDVEALMGILTRFMIDEYPAMRHTGIGMGSRRPIEVWNEINDTRGCILKMDADLRRIHLGWECKATPSDEGVKVFSGLWYTSDALQEKREELRHKGKVSVFVDPDDVTRATVLMPKSLDPIPVDLQITAFADMTVPEVLELLEIQRREDPRLTEYYEDRLARIRRERFNSLRAIGVEKRLRRSYSTLEECARKARALFAGARIIRNAPLAGTTPAGRVTDLTPGAHVFQIGGEDMLIDGQAEPVEMFDLAHSEEGADVPMLQADDALEAESRPELLHAPSMPRQSQKMSKDPAHRPTSLGRPSRLKDLE